MGTHESIVTVGMRGDGDMPMTAGSNIALLERIVADQRKIIADVTGKDASATPQLWALYKEVQDYYDKGMRVPDDVTLLFSDDNWGNIRRLPVGHGHASLRRIRRLLPLRLRRRPAQLQVDQHQSRSRASGSRCTSRREYGANADLDRERRRPQADGVPDLVLPRLRLESRARGPPSACRSTRAAGRTRQFGAEHAPRSLTSSLTHSTLAGRRKPELLDTATYSLTNYREAETVVAAVRHAAQ